MRAMASSLPGSVSMMTFLGAAVAGIARKAARIVVRRVSVARAHVRDVFRSAS
jgi:hypothetical protein